MERPKSIKYFVEGVADKLRKGLNATILRRKISTLTRIVKEKIETDDKRREKKMTEIGFVQIRAQCMKGHNCHWKINSDKGMLRCN